MLIAGILAGVAAALTTGVVWLRRRYVVVGIVGTSMLPTYRPGDRVVVRRTPIHQVRRGQVVVVSSTPGASWVIKRAAAVPGDPVPAQTVPDLAGDRTVPAGRLILLGDNPADSFDSRQRGYYGEDDLLGVVLRSVTR
jgi:signal peptidase I